MKRIISQWIPGLLMVFLAACNLPQSAAAVQAGDGGPKTWFDAPLDGSILKLEPYPVVIHAYDPGGVSQVEFSVNGSVVETLNPSASGSLGLFEYSWNPKKPGNYVLTAHAKEGNTEASVTVTIGDFTATLAPSFTPTATEFTPTFTPTLTFTPTPTIHATITRSPSPVPAKELTFEANISANQICGNDQVTIQAYASDTNLVKGITLFLKLKDQASGQSSSWSEGDPMNPAGNGWFTRMVSPSSIPGYGNYQSSWILYQFVAIGSNNSIVGRSPVYSDISVSSCAAPPVRIEPPVNAPVITLTPPRGRPPVLKKRTATLIPPPK